MKLVTFHKNHKNLVKNVYLDIYDPVIYPKENKIVFSNGKIENLPDDYVLLEDHIEVEYGSYFDDSMRDYDQSHRYISMNLETIKEEVKESVKDAVEEVKEFFTGDDDDDEG